MLVSIKSVSEFSTMYLLSARENIIFISWLTVLVVHFPIAPTSVHRPASPARCNDVGSSTVERIRFYRAPEMDVKLLIYRAARCLIIMDAEGEIPEKAVEVHCLLTEDTVANGDNHEPIHPRRIP